MYVIGEKLQASSQTKLSMGAQEHQAQRFSVRLLVNQHQIRFDVAVAMVLPLASQRMVPVTRRQRFVSQQGGQDRTNLSVQRGPVLTLAFAPVIALELTRVLRRPHPHSAQ